ncbi:hypothetical protein [Nostoc sp. CMAA1605]|nr:hypothetical protein [Nostoc sp. CMAA1605]
MGIGGLGTGDKVDKVEFISFKAHNSPLPTQHSALSTQHSKAT